MALGDRFLGTIADCARTGVDYVDEAYQHDLRPSAIKTFQH